MVVSFSFCPTQYNLKFNTICCMWRENKPIGVVVTAFNSQYLGLELGSISQVQFQKIQKVQTIQKVQFQKRFF